MTMCEWCKHKQSCNQPAWIIKAVKNDDLYCDGFKGDSLPPISFGWTTPPWVSMQKSVTRRNWAQVTVNRFKKGKEFMAWSKQARFGGEPIGIGRVTKDPYKQYTSDMITNDYIREGLEYLDDEYYEIMTALPHQTGKDFPLKYAFDSWKSRGDILTVVPFDIIEVFPGCVERYTSDAEIIRCVKALEKAVG